jgi:hypothetical protein
MTATPLVPRYSATRAPPAGCLQRPVRRPAERIVVELDREADRGDVRVGEQSRAIYLARYDIKDQSDFT